MFGHPVAMAARNLAAAAVPATLCRWDARALPVATETVDKTICNPPWGRRAGSHTANRHLYPGFVRQIARVLRVGGVAVLLSLEKGLLTGLVERHSLLRVARFLTVSVGGLHPSIYVVRKVGPWRERPRRQDV
jgi:23S rRNA G2445 N2-methylase RlmL